MLHIKQKRLNSPAPWQMLRKSESCLSINTCVKAFTLIINIRIITNAKIDYLGSNSFQNERNFVEDESQKEFGSAWILELSHLEIWSIFFEQRLKAVIFGTPEQVFWNELWK